MAIKPTIYKLSVALSDLDRDIYEALNLTIALHPSEKLERMMARILSLCLNFQERITFTKGLSTQEEPDIWVKGLDGQISLWVDIGEPSFDRIKKSSRLSLSMKVYSFNAKSNAWWLTIRDKIANLTNVECYQFNVRHIQNLAMFAKRSMAWSISISGDTVYVSSDNQACEVKYIELT